MGKTRLALEVAGGLPDGGAGSALYPDGVWLVDLAPLADGALVPRAALAAVGGREGPGRPPLDALVAHLRPRAVLLVLDNCEHLLDACATLGEALLGACPRVRLLATSREPLGLAGEAAWPVPPLPVPALPDPGAAAGAPARPRRPGAVRGGAPVRRPGGGRGARPSPSTPGTPRRWRRSAPGWTGCPWPSSWPPPACGCSRPGSSWRGWRTASAS